MKHLVIGLGEVGTALKEVLDCHGHDPNKHIIAVEEYDVMHIAFPYSKDFEEEVQSYRDEYHPQYIVVHSTVPIGTCEKLGVNHSPIRGRHPDLAASLKTFKKFVGGPDVKLLCDEFEKFGIPTYGVSRARDTEAMKLWDTTQYGAMIMLEKEIHKFCADNDVDFQVVYTEGNRTYNSGYERMGMSHVIRPVLTHQDGPIGGHCVLQNCELLDSETPNRIKDIHNRGGVDR